MQNRSKNIMAVACMASTLMAIVFAALWLFERAHKPPAISAIPVAPQPGITPSAKGPFADIPANSIPGRYRWLENGQQIGMATLHPDHSLTNVRGEKKAGYRWMLQSEGLLLVYLGSFDFFSQVAAPDAYVGQREEKTVRIEKESSLPVMER